MKKKWRRLHNTAGATAAKDMGRDKKILRQRQDLEIENHDTKKGVYDTGGPEWRRRNDVGGSLYGHYCN